MSERPCDRRLGRPRAGRASWRAAARSSRSPRWSGGRARRRASRARARSSPPTGELHGWIGGACAEPVVIREAQRVIARRRAAAAAARHPGAVRRGVPDGMTVIPISCQSEGALEVYIEPVRARRPHLVVVGRSPMAHTLADLAAALGWRADLRRRRRLLGRRRRRRARSSWSPRRATATRRRSSRRSPAAPAYVGLVASRKRGEAVLGYLADRGVPQRPARPGARAGRPRPRATPRTGRSRSPILAELVQLRARRGARPAEPRGDRPAAGRRARRSTRCAG